MKTKSWTTSPRPKPPGLPFPVGRIDGQYAKCCVCAARTGKYEWEDHRLQLCRRCEGQLGPLGGGARNLRIWLKERPILLAAVQAAYTLGSHAAAADLLRAESAR